MRPSTVDFLNHGLLPFIGRERERQRILEFWNGDEEPFGLRALLLIGEAGSGKGRLVEELVPHIEQQAGLVLHLRLRADGSASIAPLIALSMNGSAAALRLLGGPIGQTLPAVIGALRKLCALRRTLLVVEDLHLLNGATLREFGMLVDAVADEPLSLLAASRPAELTARGAMEAYLVGELRLQDLRHDDIKRLWSELFGNAPSDDLVATFANATLGNPLAFRSALQGALNAGAIGPGADGWQATIPLDALALLAERSAHQLSEGMAAHLSDTERAVAQALSTLGEVFSPEAAEQLLPGTGKVITALLFKGILVRSGTAVHPLRGDPAASLPLAFTHTLLHRTLFDSATVDPSGLARVVAAHPPIYSVLPYRLLAESPSVEMESVAQAQTLVYELLVTATRIDNTSDWELAPIPLRAAQQIADNAPMLREPEVQRWAALSVLSAKLGLNGRNDNTMEFRQQAEQLVAMAAEPIADHLRRFRISGYLHLFKSSARLRRDECPEIISAVEAMVEQQPELRRSREYAGFLRIVASMAYIHGLHIQDLRYVEQSIGRVMAEQGNATAVHTAWLQNVGHHLLLAFSTPDELAARRALLLQLEEAGIDNPRASLRTIAFHADTGAAQRAIAEADRQLPTLRDLGLLRTIYSAQHYRCQCLLLVGQPMDQVLRYADEVLAAIPPAARPQHQQHMGEHLTACALICGQAETAERLIEKFQLQPHQIGRMQQLLLACWSSNPAEAIRGLEGIEASIPDNGPDDPDANVAPLVPALVAVRSGTPIAPEGAQQLLDLLSSPILRRYTILAIHAACSLGELLIEMELMDGTAPLMEAMETGIANALRWGKENGLPPVVAGIQQRYVRLRQPGMTGEEPEPKTPATIAEAPGKMEVPTLRIGMFGPITVQHPNGAAQRLRGTRNQIILSLLVADRMLKNPLSRNRFIEIASGASVAESPDKARRGMNMGILRLREAIGQQAIATDGETPQLNLSAVAVDLLESQQALQRVAQLTRRGALTEARQSLTPLLHAAAQGAPFAGMDDELFQNLRSQWEQEFRHATQQLLERLRTAGDHQSASLIESQLPEGWPA
ncbi:MAG: hypothetical protein DYG96_02520 [Chlorobi bacterium CHB2]|nr:hypothetical protein [Chlorobi bacterium CHB2]